MPPESPPVLQTETKTTTLHWVTALKLIIFLVSIALVTILVSQYFQESENVPIAILTVDGSRSVALLNIKNGSVTQTDETDLNNQGVPNSEFKLSTGAVIALSSSGIVLRREGEGESTVLIASPVPPTARTPMTVWNDGAKIAWRSPADGSVQVFERSARGVYLPIFLSKGMRPNSLKLTSDGERLIIAKIEGKMTNIYLLSLQENETPRLVASISGFVTLVQTQ